MKILQKSANFNYKYFQGQTFSNKTNKSLDTRGDFWIEREREIKYIDIRTNIKYKTQSFVYNNRKTSCTR